MVNRRSFLYVLLILPIYLFFKYLSPKALKNKNEILVAKDNLATNSVYVIKDKQIAVLRLGDEYRVFSVKCTHLGCTLNLSGDRFVCPCHGSVFLLDGSVVKSPAVKNLKRIDFKEDSDFITIYC